MAGQGSARVERQGTFLRALARGGSVRAAAREAGVWPRTAYDWRERDAAFAQGWARALARARAALSKGAVPVLGDAEVVRGSKTGRPCVARAGAGRWSAAKEERFLIALAATCSVKGAARAVGVSTVAVYARRARWPDFAARWHEALAGGWHGLELALLRAANARFGEGDALLGEEDGGAAAFVEPMTVDQALILFKLHRHRVTGEGARPRHDWRRREMPIEDVRAEVLRRVRLLGG